MLAGVTSQTDPSGIPLSKRQHTPRTRKEEFEVEDEADNNYPYLKEVSNILKSAPEDIWFQIFLRLPECRSAISCGSVCRQWHSLIFQRQFIQSFTRQHDCYSSRLYTIFFRKTSLSGSCQPFLTLLSEDGKSASIKPMLSFIVWASFDDLLLYSLDGASVDNRVYYIGNPLTKQRSQLPKYPVGDLIGNPIGFALVCSKQLEYKVVLIWEPFEYSQYVSFRVATFCFGSGQWSVSSFSYPRPDLIRCSRCLDVVTCNGILYWREHYSTLDRIIALDAFNSRCDVIYFPGDFGRGWEDRYVKVWIGVVCNTLSGWI